MTEVPERIQEAIMSMVRQDLEPSFIATFLKTGVGVVFGGLISLLICGQFGLGMTPFAQDFNHTLHTQSGALVCAAICGSLFAVIPVLLLRLLCRPMQFRAIVRKSWLAPALWLGSFGALLSYHGEFGNAFVNFVAWSVSAYFVYLLIGRVLDRSSGRLSLVLGDG
jgi:hypothetical protein